MAAHNEKDLEAFSVIVGALKTLERSTQIRLLHTVCQFLGLDELGSTSSKGTPRASSEVSSATDLKQGPFSTDRSQNAKQFMLEKEPKTDVERIACLAYFLTHYRDLPHFKTLEISKLNTEAAQPKFSNTHFAVHNAVKMGYLASATKGARQISAAGEQFVSLLPDREAARAAMAKLIRRKRAARKRSKKIQPNEA